MSGTVAITKRFMTGNNKKGLVLQQRDRRLLGELGVMRVIDREQVKLVAGFGSTTRANTRLLALTRAGLLRRFFTGTIAGGRQAIYSLSQRGASLVEVPFRSIPRKPAETLIADTFLEHRMRINAIYLTVKHRPIPIEGVQFKRWVSFPEPLSAGAAIVPDGYFELDRPLGVLAMFLEVDLGTETLGRWQKKTQSYLQFAISGEFEQKFRQPRFRVLVIANSRRRMGGIRATIARLTDKIFWLSTFESIQGDRFWSACWLRPRAGTKGRSFRDCYALLLSLPSNHAGGTAVLQLLRPQL